MTREFLLGHWTDDGDCTNTIAFHADGTFTVPGGAMGVWILNGDILAFLGFAGERSTRVQAPDEDTILLINDAGSLGRSTRCRSVQRPVPDEAAAETI